MKYLASLVFLFLVACGSNGTPPESPAVLRARANAIQAQSAGEADTLRAQAADIEREIAARNAQATTQARNIQATDAAIAFAAAQVAVEATTETRNAQATASAVAYTATEEARPTMTPVPPTATALPTPTSSATATHIPTRMPEEAPRSMQWMLPQWATLVLLGVLVLALAGIVILVTLRKEAD